MGLHLLFVPSPSPFVDRIKPIFEDPFHNNKYELLCSWLEMIPFTKVGFWNNRVK